MHLQQNAFENTATKLEMDHDEQQLLFEPQCFQLYSVLIYNTLNYKDFPYFCQYVLKVAC